MVARGGKREASEEELFLKKERGEKKKGFHLSMGTRSHKSKTVAPSPLAHASLSQFAATAASAFPRRLACRETGLLSCLCPPARARETGMAVVCSEIDFEKKRMASRLVALFLSFFFFFFPSFSSSSLPSLLLPSSASTPRRLYRPPLGD